MKKTIITLIVSLICLNSFSQRVIENPKFSTTTASNVKITRIELYDTVTVLHFEVEYFPKWSITVSSAKTYIQDSKGGNKMFVKRAEGIELNKRQVTPESGKNIYKLYFPPLGNTTEVIDYEEDQWKIFDIEIVPQKHIAIIPGSLQGNWLRTDGSNEWVYGFYNNMVICDEEFWDKIMITNKGKSYRMVLQKNGKSSELFIKLAKNDNILVGSDPDKMELLSRSKTTRQNYVIKDNEEYHLPIFNMDTAFYKGYIKGYHPKMGKTGMVYVDDIISHEQYPNLVTINPDGTFYVKCFMIYPERVYVRMLGASESVYLEPGKTLIHFIDASEFTVPFKTIFDRQKRERKSLYMGECARINTDLQSMDFIYYFDYDKVQREILDMDARQYKAYCFDIMYKDRESLQKYLESNQICKKALTIFQMELNYRSYENVLSYFMYKESAYRQKNKIPRDQREIPLVREVLNAEYYSFIKPEDLNNPVSLVSGGAYNILINRIRFAERVQPPFSYMYIALSDTLKSRKTDMLPEDQEILNKLKECKTIDCIRLVTQQDSALVKSFFVKYGEILRSISSAAYYNLTFKNLQQFFGLSEGLVEDIILAQMMSSKMKGSFKPFEDEDKQLINEKVKTDFIKDYLMLLSKTKEDEIAKRFAAVKDKTGYIINETPKAEGDKLFDAIIQKYKGKVVFVDFWATWCGPCLAGMEKMKPLKDELNNKDIVFVYITDESSPVDTWNMMVPDIKGEHFRLKNDEWNYLKTRFKISGIPHYVLVNKTGEVVRDKIYFASSTYEFKELIDEYLK